MSQIMHSFILSHCFLPIPSINQTQLCKWPESYKQDANMTWKDDKYYGNTKTSLRNALELTGQLTRLKWKRRRDASIDATFGDSSRQRSIIFIESVYFGSMLFKNEIEMYTNRWCFIWISPYRIGSVHPRTVQSIMLSSNFGFRMIDDESRIISSEE